MNRAYNPIRNRPTLKKKDEDEKHSSQKSKDKQNRFSCSNNKYVNFNSSMILSLPITQKKFNGTFLLANVWGSVAHLSCWWKC